MQKKYLHLILKLDMKSKFLASLAPFLRSTAWEGSPNQDFSLTHATARPTYTIIMHVMYAASALVHAFQGGGGGGQERTACVPHHHSQTKLLKRLKFRKVRVMMKREMSYLLSFPYSIPLQSKVYTEEQFSSTW